MSKKLLYAAFFDEGRTLLFRKHKDYSIGFYAKKARHHFWYGFLAGFRSDFTDIYSDPLGGNQKVTRSSQKGEKMDKALKYIEYEVYRNETNWYSLTAYNKGYGFSLEIVNIDTNEVVFKKFLRTQDTNYIGNYIRKVARNNFNARIA